MKGSLFGDGFRGAGNKGAPKPEDVHVTVECSLEEFYCGALKKISYCHYKVCHDGRSCVKVEKNRMVQVDPGFSSKTVLTFRGEGNQAPKQPNGSLVIMFKEKKHDHFCRSGSSLIYTHKCTLEEALECAPVRVQLPDGRCLTQCFDEVVSPQTVRCIAGEGMPSEEGRGDLFIRFDIEMPKQLSNAQRQKILEALKANAAELGL